MIKVDQNLSQNLFAPSKLLKFIAKSICSINFIETYHKINFLYQKMVETYGRIHLLYQGY